MSGITNKNAEQLLASNFNKAGTIVEKLSDPLVITPMLLTLEQIKPYDHNPRQSRNPKYDEIKASIKERGLDAPPPVTRRPGDEQYMIRNGGNTRLEILWELWQETKNETFFRINTLFHPWTGEVTLLTGHLVEDELHGRLTYIDRAIAVVGAANVYKKEIGMDFTQSQLAQKLSHDGYPISQPTISQMMDTVNYLFPVIPQQLNNGMSRSLIEKVLRLRKIAKATWNKQNKINNVETEQSYTFDNLFIEVLSQYNDQPLDLNRYQDELIGRMSSIFECSYELIELEFNEKQARQRSLETPSTTTDDDFDEASLFANEPINIDNSDIELDETQILAITAPKRPLTPKVNTVTRTAVDGTDIGDKNQNQKAPILHNDDNEFIDNTPQTDGTFSQPPWIDTNTTPRLEQIQQLIDQYNHHSEPDSSEIIIQTIHMQSGVISPSSENLNDQDEIHQIDVLRQQIGQLLNEIVYTISDESFIVLTDKGLGFNCTKILSENKSVQTLIDLLQALLNQPPTMENEALLKLISLLTGLQSRNTEVVRLDDTSFIKLIRVFRLIRQYVDLTHDNGG